MKTCSKTKWSFFLAVVLVFLAGQAVGVGIPDFLCGGKVEGTLTYNEDDDSWSVDDIKFKGLPIEYLEKLLESCGDSLDGAEVEIYYHECPNLSEFKACSIEVLDCCLHECVFELPIRPGQAYRIPPASQGPPTGAGGGPEYRRRGPSN